jgi:hypothetical protein
VAGTAVPGRIRVLVVLAGTLAAFTFPATIGAASAQQDPKGRPAHAAASGSEEPVSASSRAEDPPRSRAGHRAKDPWARQGDDRRGAEPGERGNGRSPSTANQSTHGNGTGTQDRMHEAKGPQQQKQKEPAKQEKQAKQAKDEKTTGPPPGQRGSGASDRARERANASSPVGAPPPADPTPAPTPAPSVGTPAPARVPTVPLPEADRPTRRPTSTSGTPAATPTPLTPPVAVAAGSSGAAPTVAFLDAPAPAEPLSSPSAAAPPADLLGVVELPVGGDNAGSLGRSVLDAILDGAARSFQVPFLLLLALGGYVVLQRGFGRGNLPMVATDLPVSVDPGPEAGADDARYVL